MARKTRTRSKSTQRALASMALAFESFVMFFATLVAFGLKVADAPVVWGVGLSLTFILILLPAVLGSKASYYFGWLLQILVTLTGIWVPLMWLVGTIFIGLWAWAMIAGSTIDRARENFEKSQVSDQ